MALYTVTNLADSGAGSLRAALALANGNAQADTITFAANLVGGSTPAVDNGVITLGGSQLVLSNDVTIEGDIDGNGTPDITIDAHHASSVFAVDDNKTLGSIHGTLSGLVIENGQAAYGGGGVYVGSRDVLTLTHSIVSGNSAKYGGGISGAAESVITVSDSTLSDNTADLFGGGIYGATKAAITLIDSIADGNSASDGGGIYAFGSIGTLSLTNTTVSNNTATDSGGGIYSHSRTTTLTGVKVYGNSAVNYGGGIYGGNVSLTSGTISGNSAAYGGGIFGPAHASIFLTNATVSGNSADHDGGGIFGSLLGSITLTNATVSGNSAGRDGGGIIGNQNDGITLTSSTVTGNKAAEHGGGIYSAGPNGVTTLTNSIVAGNEASGADANDLNGAGDSTLVLTGSNILGSVAADADFASVTGSATVIDGTDTAALETVFEDVAVNALGVNAGVLADNGGPVQTIAINPTGVAHDAGDDSALPQTDPQDLDHDGVTAEPLPVDARGFDRVHGASVDVGAFESGGYQVTTLSDSGADATVTGNLAAEIADGGGLSLREALLLANASGEDSSITFSALLADQTLTLASGQLTISSNVTISGDTDGDHKADITISGNHASRVFMVNDGTAGTISATLDALVIRDGNAGTGGGIFLGQADALALTNSTVSGNSGNYGGGIYNALNASATLANVTLSGNSAGYGGGIMNSFFATARLTNVTLSGNSANYGGGIFNSNATTTTLTNSTLTGNRAGHLGGGIDNGGTGSATLINSIVAGNTAGSVADINGTVNLTGGNIVGDTFTVDGGSPQTGIALTDIFALVGTNPSTGITSGVLADNGGPVQTVLILHNGSADNTGSNAALPLDPQDVDGDGNQGETLPVDARGFARIVNGTVDIGAVELRDAVANNDAVTTAENAVLNGSVFASHGSGADIDAAPVTAVNGNGANVGASFALASGALVTLNADGTFSYNPNHKFDYLPAAGSGAANLTATDTFTYTAIGGDTATVTVTVTGVDSDDTLMGQSGVDNHFAGGIGNDWYFVQDAGDTVTEVSGNADRVFTSTSWTLTAGAAIENLSTTSHAGTGAIDLTGNELANLIYGNGGANKLDGGGSNDTMIGWGGNDTYVVDSAGDIVQEADGAGPFAGGSDTVQASVSYTLRTGSSIETFTTTDDAGTTAVNLTGNDVVQHITGNAGDNIIDGKGGADVMEGLGGNDWYFVDNAGDQVIETGGTGNRVFASATWTLTDGAVIEKMSTTSHAGSATIDLTGNALANVIYGNAGDNVLNGKDGNDNLNGFGGADTFVFDTAPNNDTNFDVISDMTAGVDHIQLALSVFTALSGSPGGTLAASEFVAGPAPIATDSDDHILYNTLTGLLDYDSNGNGLGGVTHIASVTGHPTLANTDFLLA